MRDTLVVAFPKHVAAFEAPGREKQTFRRLKRVVAHELDLDDASCGVRDARKLSVSVDHWGLYTYSLFLFSEAVDGVHARNRDAIVNELRREYMDASKGQTALWQQQQQSSNTFTSITTATSIDESERADSDTLLLVAFQYRPEPILPFCMASARRAVRFVHGVVALVTANAYISTLGGGHFLCKHLDQAKMMAKMQIAVSMGLHDPILESKCRINLAYNAMQAGRFRRAYKIVEREAQVAKELNNEELEKVCYAARVYLLKNYRLHKEFLRNAPAESGRAALVDNFYRQRIVRSAK